MSYCNGERSVLQQATHTCLFNNQTNQTKKNHQSFDQLFLRSHHRQFPQKPSNGKGLSSSTLHPHVILQAGQQFSYIKKKQAHHKGWYTTDNYRSSKQIDHIYLICLGPAVSQLENAPLQGENFLQTHVSAESICPV